MKWLKRGLWGTAWSVWLLLGLGLYWQLPREVGPKLCEIPLGGTEKLVGFVKGGHSLLVQPEQFVRPIALKLFNADTGGFQHEILLGDRLPQLPLSTCRTHGVIVARGQGRQMMGIDVLDIESDRWMRITHKMALNVAIHPYRSWIAFRELTGPAEKRRPLAVVDWTTGDDVFSLAPSPDLVTVGAPFFLNDGQRIAIPVVRQLKASSVDEAPTNLEIWALKAASVPERTVCIPGFRSRPRVGGAGRIAWMRQRRGAVRDIPVYDVDMDRELLAVEAEVDLSLPIGSEEFFLSRSGRTFLRDRPLEVWDVEAGAPRWNPPPGRSLLRGYEDLDAFSVHESWDQPWTKGRLQRWNTSAVHDLDSGILRFRCWSRDAEFLNCRSDDGALGLTMGDKNRLVVRSLPFRVNWLMLALCQAILALPLVLLWVMLWSRRRRRQAMPRPSGSHATVSCEVKVLHESGRRYWRSRFQCACQS